MPESQHISPARTLKVAVERFPLARRFAIARGAKTEAVVVIATITEGKICGRGECVPYARYGETVEGVVQAIEGARPGIEAGCDHKALQSQMPAGAARNALDCALLDLAAKSLKTPVYKQLGLNPPQAVTTAYTISLDSAEAMAEAVRNAGRRPVLKIKLGAPDGDVERIRAVREAAPKAELIADANEGWTELNIAKHLQACRESGFAMIEQPLPDKQDELLRNIPRHVPICADESVHDRKSLERLRGLYDLVNIKLDKTGGLTEAVEMTSAAEREGFGIMIGCMVGTSLGMAPALMLGSRARFVDLDGPLWLERDRDHGLIYEGSLVYPPSPELWG